jgi:hypothetical protein
MRDVARPGTKCGIQPTKGKNREHGANGLIEDLLDHSPKPPKTPRLGGVGRWTCRVGHAEILAQKGRCCRKALPAQWTGEGQKDCVSIKNKGKKVSLYQR